MKNASRILSTAIALVALAVAGHSASQTDKSATRYGAVPEGAYAVFAEVRAKSGMEDALRAATLPLVAKVRSEPNNLVYFLNEDRASPGHFIFYEIFASEADFKTHVETAHVKAWFARLPELSEGGVNVRHIQLRGNSLNSLQ